MRWKRDDQGQYVANTPLGRYYVWEIPDGPNAGWMACDEDGDIVAGRKSTPEECQRAVEEYVLGYVMPREGAA